MGQQVPALREWPASHLGLIWYLGQQDRGTCPAALQHSIWETNPEGEWLTGECVWRMESGLIVERRPSSLRSVCLGWAHHLLWVFENRTRIVSASPGLTTACYTLPYSMATAALTLPTTATPLWRSSSGWSSALSTENCWSNCENVSWLQLLTALCRDALEEDDDLQRVLKKAFLDADKALHRHLCHFNNGETHRARAQLNKCTQAVKDQRFLNIAYRL